MTSNVLWDLESFTMRKTSPWNFWGQLPPCLVPLCTTLNHFEPPGTFGRKSSSVCLLALNLTWNSVIRGKGCRAEQRQKFGPCLIFRCKYLIQRHFMRCCDELKSLLKEKLKSKMIQDILQIVYPCWYSHKGGSKYSHHSHIRRSICQKLSLL